MPQASALRGATLSPAETVLDMIGKILTNPKMDIREKLGVLRELCVQHISFDSPEQGIKIISLLAEIISSDPDPEVRAAALEAMERMIGLEEKAEAEQGKPVIDWRKVNVLWRAAKEQAELDTPPEAHAVSRDDGITAEEAVILVAALRQADMAPSVAPTPVAERPQPSGGKTTVAEEKPEPPIMKFLRLVADTDDEEHIRTLANRILAKIENLTALKPPASSPAPTEG